MHPNRLHAQAALWSLDTALRQLGDAIRRSHAATRSLYDDGGQLQAWRVAEGPRPTSGHADPVADAHHILLTATLHDGRLEQRYSNTIATMSWLAAKVLGDRLTLGHPPVTQLLNHAATIPLPAAAELAKWATNEDQLVRRELDLPDSTRHIPGATCPACNRVSLGLTPIRGDNLITCTNPECHCTGTQCRCDMPTQDAGIRHIWTSAQARARKAAA